MKEVTGNSVTGISLFSPVASRESPLTFLRGCFALCRRRVHEILQFLAGLEKRNLFGRHFDLLARLRIPSDAPAPLPCPKTSEASNLDFVALLQRVDDALENGLDNRLRLFAGKLGDAKHFLDQVGFCQCRLLCHRFEPRTSVTPVVPNSVRQGDLQGHLPARMSLFLSLKGPAGKWIYPIKR